MSYIGVGTVVTMMVPYTELNVNAAVAVVFDQRNVNIMGIIIAVGASAGLLGKFLKYVFLILLGFTTVKTFVVLFIKNSSTRIFDQFLANFLILDAVKTLENHRFPGVFRGYKTGTLIRSGLYHMCISVFHETLQMQPPEAFHKKAFFKNLARFTGKHLCWDLFFNKVGGLQS